MKKQRLDEPRYSIQFWDKHAPSRRDLAATLHNALSLLSEALPLALKRIGSEAVEVQVNFWRELIDWDKQTDLMLKAARRESSNDIQEAVGCVIEDWRQIVEERISKATGPLEEELDA